MKRRSILQWLAAASSALPGRRAIAGGQALVPGAPVPATPAALAPESEATLRALAATVLPASLGTQRLVEITDRFRTWLRAYRAGAELDHGYGHPKLRTTRPLSLEDYDRQLAALERAARAEGRTFAELEPERRRTLVAAALTESGIAALPERPDGRNVAADLLAFFFRGGEANDLCYGAVIGRDLCRGLPGSENPPAPAKGSR